MDLESFFNKVCDKLHLGNSILELKQITGGLTHRMFKVFTDHGKYVIKLLNPNIMKRDEAIENYNIADKLEEILKKNNISAIYSLNFNGKKMQCIDKQYFYVFMWYDGKVLNNSDVKQINCEKIGDVLSKIHNIDLRYEKYMKDQILNDIMNKGNIAVKNLPNVKSICHNDMDCKNVMWLNDEFKLIDLECLCYNNPYCELLELALCWSGYETHNIDFNLFNSFINQYFKNSKLDIDIDWKNIYYSNYNRLEWLEFNIKRSLMIDCDTEEEQRIGLNEVKVTLEHIIYYNNIKDDILENINNLIG